MSFTETEDKAKEYPELLSDVLAIFNEELGETKVFSRPFDTCVHFLINLKKPLIQSSKGFGINSSTGWILTHRLPGDDNLYLTFSREYVPPPNATTIGLMLMLRSEWKGSTKETFLARVRAVSKALIEQGVRTI